MVSKQKYVDFIDKWSFMIIFPYSLLGSVLKPFCIQNCVLINIIIKCFLCNLKLTWYLAAKTVDRLLQLPLTPKEEQLLVSYLLESSEPCSQEMLVMHYLQKARFTEAIQLNDKLKHAVLVSFPYFNCCRFHVNRIIRKFCDCWSLLWPAALFLFWGSQVLFAHVQVFSLGRLVFQLF